MKHLFYLLFSLLSLAGFSQQANTVDFISISAAIKTYPELNIINSTVTINFKVLKDVNSVFFNAPPNIYQYEVLSQNFKSKNELIGNKWTFKAGSGSNFKPGISYELQIVYKAKPKKAIYFIDWNEDLSDTEANPQIWTQGQGKYTSNWLPSIDDMNDKILFDLSITFKNGYEIIANGALVDKKVGEETTTWHYQMQKPMSSYLVALAIGKYDSFTETSKSGIPLEYYYYSKDSFKVEPTYRYSKQMFDFLEDEIGFAFPWQNYKQVPVKDFLYSGMENTSCTIFSDAFMVDAIQFNDHNYVSVNAHELAHQWFGDLVTETEGTHHWLQEGFATYYALLAERDVFGDAYYYEKLYDYALELQAQEDLGETSVVMNSKATSATFYKKGALALHMLREKVGDKAFKEAVRRYLELYQFKNVETKNFIAEVEKASKQDLTTFVDLWLKEGKFYFNLIEESLLKSDFYQEFTRVDCEAMTSKCNDWLKAPISDRAKTKIINQQPGLITSVTFENSLKARQAIANTLTNIPSVLQKDFESLLGDKSYVTQEVALYKLWVSFPQKRNVYLKQTAKITGDNAKNIRLLWLVLALNTENYRTDDKPVFYTELVSYTNSVYDFNARQSAFRYLRDMNAFNELGIQNLKEASRHHNWRFKSFATKLLKQLKKVD